MTIHASKGLEFDHVFVCSAGNAGSNSHPIVLIDEHGLGQCIAPDELGTMQEPNAALLDARTAESTAKQEEEWRLGYVALTRARESLTVSGLVKIAKAGNFSARGLFAWLLPACGVEMAKGAAGLEHLVPGVDAIYHQVTMDSPEITRCSSNASVRQSPQVKVVKDSIPMRHAQDILESVRPAFADHDHEEQNIDTPIDRDASRLGNELHSSFQRALDASNSELGVPILGRLGDLAVTLRSCHAQAEVPFVRVSLDGTIDRGRFDVLAQLPQQPRTPWVVELKSSLPADRDRAWDAHAVQLNRYCQALADSGHPKVVVTLASLTDSECVHTWIITRLTESDGLMGTRSPMDTPSTVAV
jgi:hypothetical protein